MDTDEEKKLPDLTPKQRKFLDLIIKGSTKSDAYRAAYNTKNMKQETIWRRAVALTQESKVAAWLEVVRREAMKELVTAETYTKEKYLEELSAIISLSIEAKSFGPAINATIAKGKALGHVQENINLNQTVKDNSLLSDLERLLGKEAAENAAEALGYKH